MPIRNINDKIIYCLYIIKYITRLEIKYIEYKIK